MGYGRAIASNTIWMIAGKAVTTALSLVLTAALARSLGVFQFGEYTTVFAFLTFFGIIADFGFHEIHVRELARHPEKEREITGNILALRVISGVLAYSLAALIVWPLPYTALVKWGVVILAMAMFFLTTNTTLVGVFQARHEMHKAVLGDVISRALLLGLVLYGLSADWGLLAIFSTYIAANLLNLLITITLIHKRVPIMLRFNWERWKYFIREATPLGIVTVLSVIYFRIDTVILSILQSSFDVGIYGAAYKIFEFLTFIPAIFVGNFFPFAAKLKDSPKEALPLVQKSFDALLVIGVGACFGLAVLASQIVGLVVGREFQEASTVSVVGIPVTAVHVLSVLSIALLSTFISRFWMSMTLVYGEQRRLITTGIWAVAINLLLNFIFIPMYSYVAATVVTVITEMIVLIFWQRIAREVLPVLPNFRNLPKILLAGLVLVSVVLLLRSSPLFVQILAGGAAYLASIIALNILPRDSLKQMIHYKKRIEL